MCTDDLLINEKENQARKVSRSGAQQCEEIYGGSLRKGVGI